MQQILNFIITNYELIISGVLLIISVITFILRKKPLGNVYALIFRYCLAAISMAEEHPVKGKAKLELAIDAVNELILDDYPSLDVNRYRRYIIDCIEAILSTPQKKG